MKRYKTKDKYSLINRKKEWIWNFCIAPILMLPVIIFNPCLLIAEFIEVYIRWVEKKEIEYIYKNKR